MKKATDAKVAKLRSDIRAHALLYPATVEGVACAGTAIESVTIKAKTKTFLFLREKDARFKVSASLDEVRALAQENPGALEAGTGGWVKITFEFGAPPLNVFKRWVDESYRCMANKTMLKDLDNAPLI